MSPIHLVMAGTPCQNLSIAVINRKEYNQGLEGEKSKLFYEFVRVLDLVKKYNPNVKFLLENVGSMSDEDKNVITSVLQEEPIQLNSNLVSAQDRKRYYWTNIEVEGKPADKGIVLKDIILNATTVTEIDNNSRMSFWYDEDFEFHGANEKVIATLNINGHDILKRVYNTNGKCGTLTTCNGGNRQKKILQDGRVRKLLPLEYERLQTLPDNYTEGISNTQRYNTLGNSWTADIISFILGGLK